MAQGDTDPHDEQPAIDPADLIRLKVASNETSWVLNMTEPLRDANIQGGDSVDVDLLWEDDSPMLVFGKVPADVADADDDAARTRTVTDRGKNMSVKPPRELLEGNSEYGAGLGLDRGDYDNNDPLCFDALVEDSLVALAPVGYESTLTASQERETPASASPADSTEDDSPSETSGTDDASSHPLSEEAVSAAAQATGVSTTALRDALKAIATSVDIDELATAPDYSPLDVDDHRVVVVPDHVWSDLQTRLDLEDDVLDAARLAHTRMAETLVVDAGASEYRRFSRDYDVLVVEYTNS